MLAAEALRLTAIETLLPTAKVEAGETLPTLAGKHVYDSRPVELQDLDRDPPSGYTPVISLYTSEASAQLMGEAAAATDTEASAMLVVIAELAVVTDDGDGDDAFVEPMAQDDPEARLVLAALCSQVRFLLERSVAGGHWRQLVRHIVKVDTSTFAAPDFGMRFQRVMMRFACSIKDDDFDLVDGGLPEPIRSVHAALPAGSYAKDKLGALGAYFVADQLPALGEVAVDAGGVDGGVDFPE